ncbi:DNA (cytosine-5-)-methyltransferase [Pseudaquidulcibacter saccharophilus]|uniref:DNA (cytosine-5-)-methyltransferase n=1 Tax=Pseudaquidulcibacter saccharophilus TaxID=2831900 RepID=UPI001EFEF745|nr:DNA (cytosine-5-)-methyltransferase [Pseudaquidulcibacter saccharophilus]
MKDSLSHIKVVELFAGVGGFRIGLQNASETYKVVWSNQFEPSTKSQIASEIYEARFGKENHSNVDIGKVPTSEIPNHDMLVGGFPCQDYSVARTLNQAAGLVGKKGVLWWEIERIIREKHNKPKFVFLENVDRLIKSPAKQRGRDFAIMLSSLASHGYIIEWRVINAADYGFPQRRRRVFILAYKENTNIANKIHASVQSDWLVKDGTIAKAFPVMPIKPLREVYISSNLEELTESFNIIGGDSPFENTGILIGNKAYTLKTSSRYNGRITTLSDILLDGNVPEKYYINEQDLHIWKYLKGAKKEKRINKASGFEYNYAEGGMVFPDALDKPSRTIITGEGGSAPSRFKHIIEDKTGRLRRLTPIELERLNMFPDNHTAEASDVRRAFLMGNALVTGVIEKIAASILEVENAKDRMVENAI